MASVQTELAFLGIGIELIFYGIYTVLFILAVVCLTWKRKSEKINTFYIFFCCFLFACCSTHVFIKFRYIYRDLAQTPNTTGALEFGTPVLRFADALVTLIDFFAEIVLIYRCWTIWHRNYYIIIFPTLLSLAFVSCAMSTIVTLSNNPDAAIVPKALLPLGTSSFAIPLGFNFLVTSLISGRIWYLGRQRRKALESIGSHQPVQSQNYLRDAVSVTIEAGVLYLIAQFILTVLFAINHPAQLLVSDVAVQIYGIAPTLIFVRVGLGHSVAFGGPSTDIRATDNSLPRFGHGPRMISISKSIKQTHFHDDGTPLDTASNHSNEETEENEKRLSATGSHQLPRMSRLASDPVHIV